MSFKSLEAATQADVLRELLQHWHDAKGSRRMPAWSDIRPASIKSVLPFVWSWKYDRQADRFTGRLVGDRIHKLFGANNNGRSIEDCFPRNYCAVIVPLFKRIVKTPEFYHEQGPVYAHLGSACTGERVALPLADDGGNGDGIIGATFFTLGGPLAPEDTALTTTTETWFPLD
ncbi:MAG TPA: PAS domain-containing protein [Rhizomicrobium sp.]|nr:PAS domain-containing protein [Rhizomicrobium sp.]